MLDHTLIDESSSYSLEKLKSQLIDTNLTLVEDFISQPLILKLSSFIQGKDLPWITYNYNASFRQQINWIENTVLEECYYVFKNLTGYLSNAYSKNLKYSGITLWRDTENFIQAKHTDNSMIEVAVQIYLTGGIENLGTVFIVNTEEIECKYKINCGYIVDNSKKYVHYTKKRVPKNHDRFSLYVSWGLNQ